jgi:hypothetical protein
MGTFSGTRPELRRNLCIEARLIQILLEYADVAQGGQRANPHR